MALAVVDDDVDGAVGLDGLLDDLEDALAVGGVAGHGEALAAELEDLGDGGLDGLEATAGGDDLDAALGEAQRDALADALAGAGDDGDLLVQLLHGGSSLLGTLVRDPQAPHMHNGESVYVRFRVALCVIRRCGRRTA